MSKFKSFDEWYRNVKGTLYGSEKYIAEKAYEAAVHTVLEEVFDEVQYQYSANIADEIIMAIKKSMENTDE